MDREAMMQVLVELVENETGTRPENLTDDTALTEGLGMDSIDLVGLVVQIENRFKIKIETAELRQVSTIGQILDLLQEKVASIVAVAAPKTA